jgi:heme oxygenase
MPSGCWKAAEGDGTRLIAHAYTRYLGDLSGGQILQRLLARSLT